MLIWLDYIVRSEIPKAKHLGIFVILDSVAGLFLKSCFAEMSHARHCLRV